MLINYYNKVITKQVPKELITVGNQLKKKLALKVRSANAVPKHTSYRNIQ